MFAFASEVESELELESALLSLLVDPDPESVFDEDWSLFV